MSIITHLLCYAVVGDPWTITAEERDKHDKQFFQLKPITGVITGKIHDSYVL